MADPDARLALLAGSTGLVGGLLLDELLEASDFSRVFAVTRRPLGREHPRLANRIVQWNAVESQLKGLVCNVAFCCLGTTLRRAGSEEEFRRVDLSYVVAFAAAAKAAKAQRFVVLSCVGADPAARNFYLRTKGEMEAAVVSVGFPCVDILQPSVLLGWRREMRPLELAAMLAAPVVNPLLLGSRAAYRAIPARTVAAAMVGAARSSRRGVQRYTCAAIQALARLKSPRSATAAQA